MTDKEKERESQSREPVSVKLPVGTIHLVDSEEHFVLVRTTRFLDVDPEQELIVMDVNGREAARLRVSPVRKGSFLTADILAGTPEVGNHVVMLHVSGAEERKSDSADDEVQVLE